MAAAVPPAAAMTVAVTMTSAMMMTAIAMAAAMAMPATPAMAVVMPAMAFVAAVMPAAASAAMTPAEAAEMSEPEERSATQRAAMRSGVAGSGRWPIVRERGRGADNDRRSGQHCQFAMSNLYFHEKIPDIGVAFALSSAGFVRDIRTQSIAPEKTGCKCDRQFCALLSSSISLLPIQNG